MDFMQDCRKDTIDLPLAPDRFRNEQVDGAAGLEIAGLHDLSPGWFRDGTTNKHHSSRIDF
jgi:hypothetical protein